MTGSPTPSINSGLIPPYQWINLWSSTVSTIASPSQSVSICQLSSLLLSDHQAVSQSLKSSSLLLLSHCSIKRGSCTIHMRWLPKSKKGRSKDPNRNTSATFCVRGLASSCAPMWSMTLTILGKSIVHIILGFLNQDAPYSLMGHHSRDRKLLGSLQSKFQMTMTMMF